jgi:hypothetical protein
MLFSAQWPPEKRALLPTIAVYHLESESAPQGQNWNGRTTKPFAPANVRSWDWWSRWIIRHWRRHHPRPRPKPHPKPYQETNDA